jgi:Gp157 protein
MLKSRAAVLQQEIANLYLQYPELVDDDTLRVDTLEGATDLKELLTAIVRGIDDARALRDGTKLRLDELKARHDRFKMRIEFLRAMIIKILAHAGMKKIELPDATLSIKAGVPRVLGSADPASLPDDLCRVTREADMAKIRQRLQDGGAVPGYALSNAEPSLAVYVR